MYFLIGYSFLFLYLPHLSCKNPYLSIYFALHYVCFSVLVLWSYFKASCTKPGFAKDIVLDGGGNSLEETIQMMNQGMVREINRQSRGTGDGVKRQQRSKYQQLDEETKDDDQSAVEQETSNNNSPVITLDMLAEDLKHKICTKCNYYKPPRAHHCKACDRCVLRMDHHCIYIANCVGIENHKYFTLLCNYLAAVMLVTGICHITWIAGNYQSIYDNVRLDQRWLQTISF